MYAVVLVLQVACLPLFAQSITCPANLTVSTRPGTCNAIVNQVDPVFSPADARVTYNISGTTSGSGVITVSGTSFNAGVSTVTYFLPDYPGVSCSFTITVLDQEPPQITCPANLTYTCADDVPPMGSVKPFVSDNCTSSEVIDVDFVSEVRTNQTCVNRFVLTRTYRATDESGNSSTCSSIITVYDNKGPEFDQSGPAPNITVNCLSEVPPAEPDEYTAHDNCGYGDFYEEAEVTFAEVKSDSTCPGRFTLTRTWTATDLCGNQTVYKQVVRVADTIAPTIDDSKIQELVSVTCAGDIPVVPKVTALDDCTGDSVTVIFSEVKSDEQCANKFKLTRTWTATDACGNTSRETQVILVNDYLPPVFDGPEAGPFNVSCEKDIPAVVPQTATDNCGTPTIVYTEEKENILCTNRFDLVRRWLATDACGNSTTRVHVYRVYDNEPPTVSAISVDTVVLWPPNHKMREITVNYTAEDNCGTFATLNVSSNEPVHGGSDGDQAPDWEVVDDHHVRLRAEKANNGQARYYTIRITITDGCNEPVVDSVIVVVAHNITAPHTGKPFKVGSNVSFSGAFWDKPGNNHTAKWLLDGNAVANGTVTEPSGNANGKVTGSYKFKNAGVYKLQMNVTDQAGLTSYANTNEDLDAIVVIYDPNGGNAYGGGWFQSPAGALDVNPAAEGKASYGFAVNYKNPAKPKGETQFEFKVGSLEFNALNFDYLAINGARAQFRGTGRIIGVQSGIGFIMTITDGSLDGSGVDKIRMKIYNRNTGHVYYDNQRGAGDADDPLAAVGTNSTIVIQGPEAVNSVARPETGTAGSEDAARETDDDRLQVIAYPNPSHHAFTVQVNSSDNRSGILLQVIDQQGRVLENKVNLVPGSAVRLGENLNPGVYYVRVIQAGKQAVTKLVKVAGN